MFLSGLRGALRRILVAQFVRLMNTEEVRSHLNRTLPDYGDVRRRIGAHENPYHDGSRDSSETLQAPIFVTGRFRSGSTLLWNIFRNLEGYTAYYEPFNERCWFDMKQRGHHTDNTHRGVSEYWSEYAGLDALGDHYREDWIRHGLHMDHRAFDMAMKVYIDTLISSADGRAVLQFNRVDFRLGWLRANFPEARIVHIYRNPRDQWCSTLRQARHYPSSMTSAQGFIDHFYLRIWSRDLCRQFPFLTDYEDHHQYYLFYLLWKLSYCFGRHYADISVAMEELTSKPDSTVRSILRSVGGEPEPVGSTIGLSFVKPSESRWAEYASATWFQAIEEECDAIVDNFLQGPPRT